MLNKDFDNEVIKINTDEKYFGYLINYILGVSRKNVVNEEGVVRYKDKHNRIIATSNPERLEVCLMQHFPIEHTKTIDNLFKIKRERMLREGFKYRFIAPTENVYKDIESYLTEVTNHSYSLNGFTNFINEQGLVARIHENKKEIEISQLLSNQNIKIIKQKIKANQND